MGGIYLRHDKINVDKSGRSRCKSDAGIFSKRI